MLVPALFLIVLLRLIPLVFNIGLSLSDANLARPQDPVTFVGLDNYRALFANTSDFPASLVTTVMIVVPSLVIEMILGLALAVWLTRRFPGNGLARIVILIPYIVTPVVIGNFFRMFYNAEFGQLNYFLQTLHITSTNVAWLTDPATVGPAVIAMEVWHSTAFVTLLCLAGLLSLPTEPLEAARVDGASAWQSFRYITLPMLMPILVATVALRAMDILQIFDELFVMTGGGPGHLSEVFNLYLYRYGFRRFDLGVTDAAALVLVILVVGLGSLAALSRVRGARRTAEA
jgi:multiple sugar transport system permease protein